MKRETEGAPYVLGMTAGVLLILSGVISCSVGMPLLRVLSDNPLMPYVWAMGLSVGLVINPGVYLLLLFLGKHRMERGKPFAVAWMAIGAYTLISVFIPSISQIGFFVVGGASRLYGGYAAAQFLRVAGGALMIASCVQFFRRLQNKA